MSINLKNQLSDLEKTIKAHISEARRRRPGWQTGKGLNMIDAWKKRCENVLGQSLDCGHFIPEEKPKELLKVLLPFLEKIDKQKQKL